MTWFLSVVTFVVAILVVVEGVILSPLVEFLCFKSKIGMPFSFGLFNNRLHRSCRSGMS